MNESTASPRGRAFLDKTRTALAAQRGICERPGHVVDAVFEDLLQASADTAFGREHGIARVLTRRDWKAAVPIRDYEELSPFVVRQLTGERNVLTTEDPYAFLRTSGTTGHAKLVPVTTRWRRNYRGPALYAQWGLYFEYLGTERLDGGEVLDLSWEPKSVLRYQQGFPVYGITERPLSEDPEDWRPPWRSEDWFAGLPGAPTLAESLYAKVLRLAGQSLQVIVSVNPSKIVLLAETLRDNSERLVRDLHDGRGLIREADPELARRVAAICARADGRPLLTDLWPQLRLLVSWNSASAALYRPWLSRLAPGVDMLPFSTTGTEGIVTLPVDGHLSAGPLAVNQGYFEFVPWRELDNGSPLPADSPTLEFGELEEGCDYRLVMSQANGLYRYDVGDVYRVIGSVGVTPRLEFLGRAGFQSSFTGEKVTESDVHTAVTKVLGSDRTTHPDFSGIPVWGTPPCYLIAIEWTGRREPAIVAEIGSRIDEVLQEVNVEYADKRRSGRLRPLRLLTLVPGAFARVADDRFSKGAASAQIKHHWLQKDDALLGDLRELELITEEPAAA